MNAQFREPLFKANFALVIGEFSEVTAFMRARDFEPSIHEKPKLAKTILLEHEGCSEVVIWFGPNFEPRHPDGMAVLAHEALHAVHFTLRERGMECSTILDEVGNYFVEWLVREIAERAISWLSPAARELGYSDADRGVAEGKTGEHASQISTILPPGKDQ